MCRDVLCFMFKEIENKVIAVLIKSAKKRRSAKISDRLCGL